MAEPAVPEKPKKIPFGQILFSVLGFFAYLAVEFLFIGALIFGSKEEHSSGVVRTGLLYATDGLYYIFVLPCLTLALTILFCFALGIRNKPGVATFGSRKHKFVGFARVIAWVAVALTNFELISFFDTLIQDIVATSAFWVQYVVVLGHPQLLLILFPGFLAWRLLKKCKDIFNPTLVAWN